MNNTFLFVTALAFGALSFTLVTQSYTLDKTSASVTYVFPGEKVEGSIGNLEASITFDPANLSASSISGSVDVATIDTGIKPRNGHLQSKKYFDADNHPKLNFNSKRFTDNGDGTYEMVGDITLKGVSKETVWTFTFENNTFNGTTSIYASDFGVYGSEKKRDKSKVDITVNAPVK